MSRYIDVSSSLCIAWVSMVDVLAGLRIGYKVTIRRALFGEVVRALRISIASLVAIVCFGSKATDRRAMNFALRRHVFFKNFLLIDIFNLGLVKGANGSLTNLKDRRAFSNHTQAFRCFGCTFNKAKHCALLMHLSRAEDGQNRLA